MIRTPGWMPTGMTWWAAVLWTLLEIVILFGLPLGFVALSGPLEHLGQRLKATRNGRGQRRRAAAHRRWIGPKKDLELLRGIANPVDEYGRDAPEEQE